MNTIASYFYVNIKNYIHCNFNCEKREKKENG